MASRRTTLVATGALAGLALVALLLVLRAGGSTAAAEQYLLPAPLPAPEFELTAHTGEPARLSDLAQGDLVVLFFGYTHCPDICPLTLADLGRARAQLGADAERVKILFVTVDPARDTPAQLADYVKRFPPGILGLTGSEEALQRTASDYLAFAERAPASGGGAMGGGAMGGDSNSAMPEMGGYLFDHTARSFVVKDRRVVMTFPPQTPAKDITAGLKLLLKS